MFSRQQPMETYSNAGLRDAVRLHASHARPGHHQEPVIAGVADIYQSSDVAFNISELCNALQRNSALLRRLPLQTAD